MTYANSIRRELRTAKDEVVITSRTLQAIEADTCQPRAGMSIGVHVGKGGSEGYLISFYSNDMKVNGRQITASLDGLKNLRDQLDSLIADGV